MTRPLLTGSAIERAAICAASIALPSVHVENEYADAGRVLHRFLETCATSGRDVALEEAPEEHRLSLEAVNTEALAPFLSLTPELAFAYDTTTGATRLLGQSIDRKYETTDDEIPMTIDLAGVDLVERVGVVADYKRGWSKRARARVHHQLRTAALCLARLFGLVRVDVYLISIRTESSDPHPQHASFTSSDLEEYALELAEIHREVRAAREELVAGRVPSVRAGDHCHRCPARYNCPAHTALVRQVTGPDFFDRNLRIRDLSPDQAARAFVTVQSARRVLDQIEGQCRAMAAETPLRLGELDSGRVRWLGEVAYDGNESLDGDATFDAIAEYLTSTGMAPELAEEAAGEAVKLTTTKKAAEAVVKRESPRGKKEKAWEAVLEAIRAAGGARRERKSDVKVYTTAPDGSDPRAE